MKPDETVTLIWHLSAREAAAAQFEFIEPAHFFNAILKFAELEDSYYGRAVGNADIVSMFVSQREAVVRRLKEFSIEVPGISTQIRRSLRKAIGRGGHPSDGHQPLRRSENSRQLFTKAAEIARNSGRPSNLSVIYLLDAILDQPPQEISKILQEMNISLEKPMINSPLLDQYGRDLYELVSGREKKSRQSGAKKDPICNVVIDEIFGRERKSVLLIQAGSRSPAEIVENIAGRFTKGTLPPTVKNRRIIELDIPGIIGDMGVDKGCREVEILLQNIARTGNIVLFFSNLGDYIETEAGKDIIALLHKTIPQKTLQFIVSVKEQEYRYQMANNPVWEKLFRIIWLHNLKIPPQL